MIQFSGSFYYYFDKLSYYYDNPELGWDWCFCLQYRELYDCLSDKLSGTHFVPKNHVQL